MNGDRPNDPIDAALSALASRRRRYLLYYLREEAAVTVDELAAVVTGWTAVGTERPVTDGEDFERTLLALRHVDVPKLEAAGLVEVDHGADAIRYRPGAGFVDDVLDATIEHDGAVEAVPGRGDLNRREA